MQTTQKIDVVIYVDHSQLNPAAINRLNGVNSILSAYKDISVSRQNVSIYDYTVMSSLKAAPANRGRTMQFPQVCVNDEIIGNLENLQEAHNTGLLREYLTRPDELEGRLTTSQMLFNHSEEKRRHEEEERRAALAKEAALQRQREEIERENEKLRMEKERVEAERLRNEAERRRIELENQERLHAEQARLEEENLRQQKQREIAHAAAVEAARLKKQQEEERIAAAEAAVFANKVAWLASMLISTPKAHLEEVLRANNNDANVALDIILDEDEEQTPVGQPSMRESLLDFGVLSSEPDSKPVPPADPSPQILELETLRQESAMYKNAMLTQLPSMRDWIEENNKRLELDLLMLQQMLEMKERQLSEKQALLAQITPLVQMLSAY